MSNAARTDRFTGRVAIVTGGGTGIGREIALSLAREGADVVVCGRRSEPIQAVAQEIAAMSRRSLAIQANVSDEDEICRLVARTFEELGPPQVLINNASVVGQVGPVTELELDNWNASFAINITGPMLLCKFVIPHMKQAGGGTIVNISSNVGRRGFPNRAPYVCSKWALHGLTQTVALEVASDKIRVNAVCPGPVLTERLLGSMRRMAETRGISVEDLQREWESESPMGRFATIQECARVTLFLASDDSSGMTGQALNVTAGVVMT